MATPPATEPEVEVVEGEVVPDEPEAEATPPELALAIREEQAAAVQPQTYLPTPKEYEAMTAMALGLHKTKFVPESYRGKPEEVLAAILTGRELGIGPMQALRDIHMIDGRPAFAAHLLLAKLRAGGIVVLESQVTDDHAWIRARRTDTGEEGTFEFTMDDAKAAKLDGKKNWLTYRQDMLWARAVSRMARRMGSDLLGGLVYSKEELDDFDGSYGSVGEGYDASAVPEFNPGQDKLPGLPKGNAKEVSAALWDLQRGIAADLDWAVLLEEAAIAALGAKAEWKAPQKREFMLRWANTITRLAELASASEAYHPELGLKADEEGDAVIVAAFEWGFGMTPSLPFVKLPVEVVENVGDEVADGD